MTATTYTTAPTPSTDTLMLDQWRALVDALGERSPERRALADRELERLASAPERWDPPTADETAVELARVFESVPPGERSASAVERSRLIARHLASARPRTADLARALGERSPSGQPLSLGRTRALVAAHRARYQHTGPDENADLT